LTTTSPFHPPPPCTLTLSLRNPSSASASVLHKDKDKEREREMMDREREREGEGVCIQSRDCAAYSSAVASVATAITDVFRRNCLFRLLKLAKFVGIFDKIGKPKNRGVT
jgi:hypothetical protein